MLNTMRKMIAMLGMMLGRRFGIRLHSCKEVVELLADYLEDELPANEKHSIDLHVMACENCRNFTDSYRETGRLARSLRYEEIPADFRSRLRDVLAQRLRNDPQA